MLVWLASYPRSGNTFVRVVLNDVFGIKTRSLSGEGDYRVFSSHPGVIEAVGHLRNETQGPALIEEARQSDQLYIVKTHEPPVTQDPAIYIVRDGRSSIVSYFHYLNEVENIPTTMESVIEGHVYAGLWSSHFAAWQPLERPNTLLLRYEDIVKRPDRLIERLGAFCSATPQASTPRSFADLHQMFPSFFRKSDDAANIREIEPHLPSFMRLHGELMWRLNYLTPGDPASGLIDGAESGPCA